MQQSWRGLANEVRKVVDERLKRVEKQLKLLEDGFYTTVNITNSGYDTTAEEQAEYKGAPELHAPSVSLGTVNNLPVLTINTETCLGTFYNQFSSDDFNVTVYYIMPDACSGTMTCSAKAINPGTAVNASWEASGTATIGGIGTNVVRSQTYTLSLDHEVVLVGIDYAKTVGGTATVNIIGMRYNGG